MKKFLQVIGALLYSAIASSLIYLLFWWVTPFIMMINGWGVYIIFLLFAETTFMSIVASGTTPLAALAAYITRGNKLAKIAYVPIFVIMGLWSCLLPFNIDIDYTAVNWAVAITQTINIAITFIAMIYAVFIDMDD